MLPSQYIERGWTQGTFARDQNGAPVNEYDSSAVCWCASGAISRAFPESYDLSIQRQLSDAIEHITRKQIVIWNDNAKTTKEQVISVVKEAEQKINVAELMSKY